MPSPSMLACCAITGSTFGSIGSIHGGTKMRAALDPIWCTSYTICGCHTLCSCETTARVSACEKMYQSRLLSWPTYF